MVLLLSSPLYTAPRPAYMKASPSRSSPTSFPPSVLPISLLYDLAMPATAQMEVLDKDKDTIMSVACFITDYELNMLDETGYGALIQHSQEQMDAMGEWCTEHHGSSGLTKACLASSTTAEQAADEALRCWALVHGMAVLALDGLFGAGLRENRQAVVALAERLLALDAPRR